ncbi:MAG: PatB family C-S lyase [Bacteroidales bacterium]|nr:PatB family C-S lyase [Bacteroidales bacterium]
MKYNFDTQLERSGTDSVKYDLRKAYFGNEDVIPLWVADMDFETPDFILNALRNRLEHPVFGYGFRSPDYHKTIVKWMHEQYEWSVKSREISFSPGVVPGLTMAILTFSKPKDKILVQPPVYFPFYISVKDNDRELVYNELLETKDGYRIDFNDLEAKLKTGVKIFIMSSPHNPVGRAWSLDELKRIVNLCEKYDVLILSDEIHADLTFLPRKHIPIASISEEAAQRTITFMAASKTFNIAGLSTAFVVIKHRKMMRTYNQRMDASHLYTGNIMGTIATKSAFDNGNSWRMQMLDYVNGNIDFVEEFLADNMPNVHFHRPEATYLLWLDFRDLGMSQKKLIDILVNKAGVGLNDGTIFNPGGEGFMRLNVACPRAVLQKALEQISKNLP